MKITLFLLMISRTLCTVIRKYQSISYIHPRHLNPLQTFNIFKSGYPDLKDNRNYNNLKDARYFSHLKDNGDVGDSGDIFVNNELNDLRDEKDLNGLKDTRDFIEIRHNIHDNGVRDNSCYTVGLTPSGYTEDVVKRITENFDNIRDDKIELVDNDTSLLKKNLYLRSYTNLTKYTQELDTVLNKATFVGCTIVELDKKMDNCLLHFRGYERGESHTLCFNPKYFPLFPTVYTPFKGVTERSLDYFEHILSGLTGLRVSKVHTPYPFRSIIAIEFGDSTDLSKVLYKLLIVSEKTNKLILVDNIDQIVLGSSECLLEGEVKDYPYIGKKLEIPDATKIIPRPDETYEEFMSHLKSLNGENIFKALHSVYQGIDYKFVTSLCSEFGIEPTLYIYKIPDTKSFHEVFISKIKSILNKEEPYYDIVKRVYELYGCLSPSYKLNRMLEKTTKMSNEFREKLEKLVKQCDKDENYEKLYTVNEKIENIEDYQSAIKDIRLSKDPKKLENLMDFYNQLLMIHDLPGYKLAEKKKKVEQLMETKVQTKAKKVGKILHVPVNDNDDCPMMIVGKNAQQNEVITHDLRKKGDLWFHTKDCPGSHLLLRNYKNDKYSVQIAADIASYFSKYRLNKNVEVIVANIEDVKKSNYSLLGSVIVNDYKTVVGDPERGGKFIENYKAKTQQ